MKSGAITAKSVCLLVFLAASPALAQSTEHDHSAHTPTATAPTQHPAKAESPASARVGDPYPLSTCPISGGKLGSMGAPIAKLYDGREVRFCCKSCPPKFEKDLAKSLAALDDAIIKDQAPIYPIKTSIVTGKALPDKPLEFVYGNRLVRVASDEEKAAFMKDPAKFMTELDKAVVEAQGKNYPLKKCPVSGEEFGGDMGEAVDVVIANRLVRLCCKSCKKDVEKEPAKFIAMVDDARKGTSPKPDADKGKHDDGHDHKKGGG